jgi:hypothetical protein
MSTSARLIRLAFAAGCAAPLALAQEPLFLATGIEPATPLDCGEVRVGALRTELLEGAAGLVLELDLPGLGVQHLVQPHLDSSWGGGSIWTARVQGDANGSATFSLFGDTAIGTVRVHERLFAIEAAPGGLHRVRERNESLFPGCGLESAHEVSSETSTPATGGGAAALTGTPTTIDVLVVYTTEAKDVEGNTAAIQAKVNLAIAETNQAYANSQVTQRLRLVHQAELTSYVEDPSFSTMLGDLRDPSDGVLDSVHALRDQYGADMVAMIVAGSQYCGIGYLMQTVDPSFDAYAFTVTSRLCATGYYSFGHELGHNMGCHHDRDNASVGAFPYSYGYRTANGQWRTVMAYAPGTRIQYFSNPNVSYSGQALGSAHPAPDSAENWSTLNNTAATVAQFRCALPAAFGTSKTTSIGTSPLLTAVGSPSVSGGGLQIRISNAIPDRTAIAFYGHKPGAAPWNGGTLYVAGPKIRLGVQQLDASGATNYVFPIASVGVPGEAVYCQGWFRDPAALDGTTIGLTHGLRVDFCP